MKKVLITGAAGAIGSSLVKYLNNFALTLVDRCSSTDNVFLFDLSEIDEFVEFLKKIEPHVVLHLAGCKDVRYCENHPEFAYKTNVEITKGICDALAGTNMHFVFVSSDYVFRGDLGGYSENSHPAPTTVYGKNKSDCESYIQSKLKNYTIVRSSSVYGYPNDFIDVVSSALYRDEVFPAFEDLVSNPTSISDLAVMLNIVLEKAPVGIYHLSGCESMSRYIFSRKIADTYGLNSDIIRPSKLPENDIRPRNLSMHNAWSFRQLQYYPKSINDSLKLHLAERRKGVTGYCESDR